MKLNAMIDFWAKLKPSAPAIVMFDVVITYQALSHAINAVAGHLSGKIADMTAPAGILIDHPARNIVVNCALMRLGIPSIIIRENQVDYLKKIGARTLVYDGQVKPAVGLALVRIEAPWFTDQRPPKVNRRGTARRTKLTFTSGTTGVPKAISFADEDIVGRSNYLRAATGDVPWMRSLIVPGLSTNFAFSQIALAFEMGRTISFGGNPDEITRAIEVFRIDVLICSPQQALSLSDFLAQTKQHLRALKCVFLAGAVPTATLVAKINTYLCRDVVCVYAATEIGITAFGTWDKIKHVEGAVGFICPWANVECVDENGNALPPGKTGEIRIKTPHPGLLYGSGPDPDDAIDTWFYPGDRGLITPDGMLVIHGRATDTINKGGMKLSSSIIDQCLAGVSGVQDAAVCSIPGSGGTDEIVALVIAVQPVALATLNAALKAAKIEATLDHVQMVDKIPRNETGKVNREELRQLARLRRGN